MPLRPLELALFTLLAAHPAGAIQTQAQLVELWQVKQPSVLQTLQQLIETGAVEALPRRVREVKQYMMAGISRLVF